jgi:hypothetical protein
MGVKSKNRYLGFTFGGLWFIGLVSAGILTSMILSNFDARAREKQDYTITQPKSGKLIVSVPDSKVKVYGYGRWFKMDGILNMTEDSLFMNNVRLRIVRSSDSLYHINSFKYSNGPDESAALKNVKQISFGINQEDSLINLDRGFSLQRGTRFRNQGVTVNILVPIGKRIVIKGNVSRRLNSFDIHTGRNDQDFEDDWNNDYGWSSDVEYVMTASGLERVDKKDSDEDKNNGDNTIDQYKKSKEQLQKEYEKKQKEAEELKKELDKPVDSTKYHYKKAVAFMPESTKAKSNTDKTIASEEKQQSVDASRLLYMQMVL